MQYALVGKVFLEYQRRIGAFNMPLHQPLAVLKFEAQCAVARHGRVGVDEVNKAIVSLKNSGRIEALYKTYR